MGNAPELLPLLAAEPYFAELGESALRLLAAAARQYECRHGHYLFMEGDPADQFYLVLHGKVGLQMGAGSVGLVTIETISDHEVIGWSWLFPPYRWTLTARALCPTRYLVFNAPEVRALCAHDPHLSYQLMKRTATTIAHRLHAARLSLINNLA